MESQRESRAIFRLISCIKGDSGRISYRHCSLVGHRKPEWRGYRLWKNFDDKFSRFVTIPKSRDRWKCRALHRGLAIKTAKKRLSTR